MIIERKRKLQSDAFTESYNIPNSQSIHLKVNIYVNSPSLAYCLQDIFLAPFALLDHILGPQVHSILCSFKVAKQQIQCSN